MAVVGKNRQALRRHVQARRADPQLGMSSQRALAEAANVSPRTVARLEAGDRVGSNSEHRIEQALLWQPGSIEAILSGGEPVPIESDAAAVADNTLSPAAAHAAMLITTWQDEGNTALHRERQQLRKQLSTEQFRQVTVEFHRQVAQLWESDRADARADAQ